MLEKATFTKIRDGWGLRVEGDCSPGMRVMVTRRDGQTKTCVVGSIVWQKDGVFLCTIATHAEIRRLDARPNHNFNRKLHRTLPVKPIPPDDGTVPFDPPYAKVA